MRIWLITIGEPLPTDQGDPRLLRTGILAEFLADHGHQVVWWSSTFDHLRKRQRAETAGCVRINDNLTVNLLHGQAYTKNISLRRIGNHRQVAKEFAQLAAQEDSPPDIILCSLPTLELSRAAVSYGKSRQIPVVLDVRDLWPDLLVETAPWWSQPLARCLLAPMFWSVRASCSQAAAITGLSKPYVDWGVAYAGRNASQWDRDFPLGYKVDPPSPSAIKNADARWGSLGLEPRPDLFVCCFFGTLGRQFDIDTLIEAARMLENQIEDFRFVICGDGERLEYYRKIAEGCSRVIFPGWVNEADIWTLMRRSKVGLAPYRDVKNFRLNLPNKPIEYFSAGLPVVSSVDGVLGELLTRHGCGLIYDSGDAEGLCEQLRRLYEQPPLQKQMADSARELFMREFSAEKVYREMMNYMEALASEFRTSEDWPWST